MMTHELMTLPEYFNKVVKGDMTFEIRKDDRNYQIGDTLVLKEWLGEYTGRKVSKVITYILSNNEYLQNGYIALGFK